MDPCYHKAVNPEEDKLKVSTARIGDGMCEIHVEGAVDSYTLNELEISVDRAFDSGFYRLVVKIGRASCRERVYVLV